MDWNIIFFIIFVKILISNSDSIDGRCPRIVFNYGFMVIKQGCCVGFRKDPLQYKCYPICSNGCVKNSTCIAPNVCKCDNDYVLFDNKCVSPCDCYSSFCKFPEQCDCLEGYILKNYLNSYGCEPVCSEKCISGRCTAPETCTCNKGFELNVNNPYICEPICTDGCINGTCTEPNTCTCNNGYTLNNYTCEPKCKHKCINGFCSAPEICACYPGYILSKNNPYLCEVNITNMTKCMNGTVCMEAKNPEMYGTLNRKSTVMIVNIIFITTIIGITICKWCKHQRKNNFKLLERFTKYNKVITAVTDEEGNYQIKANTK